MKIKLNDYIKRLINLKQKYGDNLLLIYSNDDEGNWFDEVVFEACEGYYNKKTHEFMPIENDNIDNNEISINAICIN